MLNYKLVSKTTSYFNLRILVYCGIYMYIKDFNTFIKHTSCSFSWISLALAWVLSIAMWFCSISWKKNVKLQIEIGTVMMDNGNKCDVGFRQHLYEGFKSQVHKVSDEALTELKYCCLGSLTSTQSYRSRLWELVNINLSKQLLKVLTIHYALKWLVIYSFNLDASVFIYVHL